MSLSENHLASAARDDELTPPSKRKSPESSESSYEPRPSDQNDAMLIKALEDLDKSPEADSDALKSLGPKERM